MLRTEEILSMPVYNVRYLQYTLEHFSTECDILDKSKQTSRAWNELKIEHKTNCLKCFTTWDKCILTTAILVHKNAFWPRSHANRW